MSNRRVLTVVWGLVILVSGCAHHRVVGRPPTAAEIEAIDRSADGSMTLRYLDPEHPCAGALCVVEDVRPVSSAPPLEIERITGGDERQLRVVARTGDAWNLDLAALAGVTTQSHAAAQGAVAGAIGGLALGGAIVFLAYFFAGSPADTPGVEPSKPLSAPAALGTCLVSAGVGALIGTILGDQTVRSDTFDFGGGHLAARTSFSR